MGCSPLLSAVNAWPLQAGPGAATTSDAPAPATPCSVAPSDLSVLEQLLAQTEGLDEEHCPSGQCGLTGGVSNNFFCWTDLATQLRLEHVYATALRAPIHLPAAAPPHTGCRSVVRNAQYMSAKTHAFFSLSALRPTGGESCDDGRGRWHGESLLTFIGQEACNI